MPSKTDIQLHGCHPITGETGSILEQPERPPLCQPKPELDSLNSPQSVGQLAGQPVGQPVQRPVQQPVKQPVPRVLRSKTEDASVKKKNPYSNKNLRQN